MLKNEFHFFLFFQVIFTSAQVMERIGKEKVEMAVMTKAESKMASIVRTWKNIIYQHLSEKKNWFYIFYVLISLVRQYVLGMAMRLQEYAVHADYAHFRKYADADENLIHLVHI